jgi:hypothetical protein
MMRKIRLVILLIMVTGTRVMMVTVVQTGKIVGSWVKMKRRRVGCCGKEGGGRCRGRSPCVCPRT